MVAMFKKVSHLDVTAFKWCMARKYAGEIAAVSRWISHCGDGGLYFLLGITLAYFEPVRGMDLFVTGILAFTIWLPTYFFIKNTIKRNRPEIKIQGFKAFLVPSDQFSFPSGHTAAAFLMATLISVFYPAFTLLAYTMSVMISLSRVLLGVHFPTDLLAGAALGSLSAVIAINILG